MPSISETKEVLHRVRIRLFPCTLPKGKGAYYARVNNERVLSVEEVARALNDRGGFSGKEEDLVSYVKQFFGEMAYQLCDGYAVSTGYFSIHPKVGGLFKSRRPGPGVVHDREKHPVAFGLQSLPPLRRLTRFIELVADDLNERSYISRFADIDSGTTNKTLTAGGLFRMNGARIKVTGDGSGCGVWFVSEGNPSLRYKVVRAFAVNTAGKIAGIVPDLPPGKYRVEVGTRYTKGGTDLKNPRTIVSGFTLRNGG